MAQGRSSFFIIILTVIITSISSLHAKDNAVSLGIGTRTCNDFIFETVEMGDDGRLTTNALLNRFEYLEWANGFMTALNIRQYEKFNHFKDLNPIKDVKNLYREIVNSCNHIEKEGHEDFSMATFVVFHELNKQIGD